MTFHKKYHFTLFVQKNYTVAIMKHKQTYFIKPKLQLQEWKRTTYNLSDYTIYGLRNLLRARRVFDSECATGRMHFFHTSTTIWTLSWFFAKHSAIKSKDTKHNCKTRAAEIPIISWFRLLDLAALPIKQRREAGAWKSPSPQKRGYTASRTTG